jgi:hypothetical protein
MKKYILYLLGGIVAMAFIAKTGSGLITRDHAFSVGTREIRDKPSDPADDSI